MQVQEFLKKFLPLRERAILRILTIARKLSTNFDDFFLGGGGGGISHWQQTSDIGADPDSC